jgi:poly(3-hydroxybutyrate) depolymerase
MKFGAAFDQRRHGMSGMGAGGISVALRGLLIASWAIWLSNGLAAHADEVVSFPSLDGALTGRAPTALRGLLLKPAGAGPFPAVVALHGCTGLFDKQGALVAREAAWGNC